jgi:hypothetical protein
MKVREERVLAEHLVQELALDYLQGLTAGLTYVLS